VGRPEGTTIHFKEESACFSANPAFVAGWSVQPKPSLKLIRPIEIASRLRSFGLLLELCLSLGRLRVWRIPDRRCDQDQSGNPVRVCQGEVKCCRAADRRSDQHCTRYLGCVEDVQRIVSG
jgi:hypothetical protein